MIGDGSAAQTGFLGTAFGAAVLAAWLIVKGNLPLLKELFKFRKEAVDSKVAKERGVIEVSQEVAVTMLGRLDADNQRQRERNDLAEARNDELQETIDKQARRIDEMRETLQRQGLTIAELLERNEAQERRISQLLARIEELEDIA